jgi:hypothetical protein
MSPREEVQAIQADTARIREVREELAQELRSAPGMFTVEVTQYMRPDGRPVIMHTDIRNSFEAPYKAIRMRGWRLAAEHLAGGSVSLAVEDDEQDFAHEIVDNGPGVQPAIERLIAAAICVPPESDRGDCDSALDPDEDNSGLEPAEEDDEDEDPAEDPTADYDLEAKYREDE